MPWGRNQITMQAFRSAPEDYAAFEAIGLASREGVRVLDVGCFDGFNTVLKFAPYRGVSEVMGIDPSPDDIARARARTDDARFTFECADIESFDAQDGRFDLVYFSHVLQHLADPQAAMRKAFDLLAPGGFVVVKTVDDEMKLSYPDPDHVMRRLFSLYERYVLPNTAHTQATDRYNGQKCYAYLKHAGFGNARIRMFATDTAEKGLDERAALFERCVYFRRNVPAGVGEGVAHEIAALVEEWGRLFECEDYYYCTTTFVAVAQKLGDGIEPWRYVGPAFGEAASRVPASVGCADASGDGARSRASAEGGSGSAVDALGAEPSFGRREGSIRPMTERDISSVMAIQIASFPDPWTPLAYAMELRHNPSARYAVETDGDGAIRGYIGWWETPYGATITQVAVDASRRRAGVGRALVACAVESARSAGCETLQLEVRAANEGAQAFYRSLGFEEVSRREGYYEAPDDDAVVMALPLASGGSPVPLSDGPASSIVAPDKPTAQSM